jgi:hypothetical protein
VSLSLGALFAQKGPTGPAKAGGMSRRQGAILSFTLGGALAITGGAFGGLALKDRSDLDALCKVKDKCPASADGKVDALKTVASISTVSFVAAAAAVGVGVVLIAIPDAGRGGKTANAWIGPGSVGIAGSF